MAEQHRGIAKGGPFDGDVLWVTTPDMEVVRMKDGVRHRYVPTPEIETDPDHGPLQVFEYAGDGG